MASSTPSRTRSLRRSGAVLAVALLMFGTEASFAAPIDAAALVAQGQRAFEETRYEEARDFYLRALALKPLPALYFNIGQCERRLGLTASAAESYRKYLALSPEGKHAPVARELLAQLKAAPPTPASPMALVLTESSSQSAALPSEAQREPAAVSTPSSSRRNTWLLVGLGVMAASASAAVVIANQGTPPPSLGTKDLR